MGISLHIYYFHLHYMAYLQKYQYIFLKMPRAFIYFVYSGTCPVMQWMFPPPTRISRA